MSTKFSIVTASFNSANYIKQAIESVLMQDYPNLEYIVMDGGSSDGTVDILKSYGEKIKWLSQPDGGIYDALNKGFAVATGDVYTWLDSDNYYESPYLFSRLAEVFESNPEAQIALTHFYVSNPDLKEKKLQQSGEPSYKQLLNRGGMFIPESIFFKSSLFRRVGGLNTSYKLLADYELWLKMFKSEPKIKKIDFTSAVFTVRYNALLRKNPFLSWQETFRIGKFYKRSVSGRFYFFIKYLYVRVRYPFSVIAKRNNLLKKIYYFYRRVRNKI